MSKRRSSSPVKTAPKKSKFEGTGLPSKCVQLPCGSAFSCSVRCTEDEIDDIFTYISQKQIIPSALARHFKTDQPVIIRLIKHLIKKNGGGSALIGKTLVATLNLQNSTRPPEGHICDALILTKKHCPFILSFSNSDDDSEITRYNINLCKSVKRLIRKFTDEKFTALFCVLSANQKEKDLKKCIKKRKKKQFPKCFWQELTMNEGKYDNLLKSLAVCIARTKIPITQEDINSLSESFYLLRKPQLVELLNSIDSRPFRIELCGDKVLLFELSERLNKSMKTVLICDDVEEIKFRLPEVEIFSSADALKDGCLSYVKAAVLDEHADNFAQLEKKLKISRYIVGLACESAVKTCVT